MPQADFQAPPVKLVVVKDSILILVRVYYAFLQMVPESEYALAGVVLQAIFG